MPCSFIHQISDELSALIRTIFGEQISVVSQGPSVGVDFWFAFPSRHILATAQMFGLCIPTDTEKSSTPTDEGSWAAGPVLHAIHTLIGHGGTSPHLGLTSCSNWFLPKMSIKPACYRGVKDER